MHDRSLFNDFERINTRPAFGNEKTFEYFELSAREDVAMFQETLQRWYNVFPDHEKQEIKERLKSDFYPAFYELAMYTYFTNLGYQLDIHPDLPASTKHPDFLASKNGYSFYIELRCLRMSSDEELLQERLKNTLLDSLNQVDATNFLLMIENIHFKQKLQPSGRKIIGHFNKLIYPLDPDHYSNLLESIGFSRMPKLEYDDDVVTISVKLMPKVLDKRGLGGRAIGSYGAYTKIGGDEEIIKTALVKKSKHYGKLHLPFLICLNYPSSFLDKEDIEKALFGSPIKLSSKNLYQGFFGSNENPKGSQVSAIMINNFT
ncbi:MAG: hypothetical protein EOO43_11490, partial [Flavobacterium sp.]